LRSSVISPATGVASSFQSPVCTTKPAGVRIASAWLSGMECATGTNSTSNEPTVTRPPTGTTVIGMSGAPGSPARFVSISVAVNGVA
jgi:hypothetical protein